VSGERTGEPQALGAVLGALQGERRLAAGMALGELGRRWPEVVGSRLAEETVPRALDRGTLVLEASSAGWAAQVRFLAAEVRTGANRVLGRPLVEEVRVVLGPSG
jgi:predicted nucleic acid-binding Zn ribbon protein